MAPVCRVMRVLAEALVMGARGGEVAPAPAAGVEAGAAGAGFGAAGLPGREPPGLRVAGLPVVGLDGDDPVGLRPAAGMEPRPEGLRRRGASGCLDGVGVRGRTTGGGGGASGTFRAAPQAPQVKAVPGAKSTSKYAWQEPQVTWAKRMLREMDRCSSGGS